MQLFWLYLMLVWILVLTELFSCTKYQPIYIYFKKNTILYIKKLTKCLVGNILYWMFSTELFLRTLITHFLIIGPLSIQFTFFYTLFTFFLSLSSVLFIFVCITPLFSFTCFGKKISVKTLWNISFQQ